MRNQETYRKYTGLGVAITTPFQNGKIDYHTFERLIDHKIDNGVDFIVALGSTGECNLLNEKEQKEICPKFFERIILFFLVDYHYLLSGLSIYFWLWLLNHNLIRLLNTVGLRNLFLSPCLVSNNFSSVCDRSSL